eukprot:IDg5795t1
MKRSREQAPPRSIVSVLIISTRTESTATETGIREAYSINECPRDELCISGG